MRATITAICTATVLLTACQAGQGSLPLDRVELPEGFEISMYSDQVPGARSLEIGESAVFVGSRDEGNVYALLDEDDDGAAEEVLTIASGLNSPNGVALHDGDLYVAEISRVIRYDDIEEDLRNTPEPVVVTDRFPSEPHHGWKFISFGPDGKLYVPVGAPCNICDAEEPFSTITRMNPDGSDFEIFAEGIRNTVGFDWNPDTDVLWFTDNGRDWLGDDRPPDELNRAPEPGLNFGYPHCHGSSIEDPKFGRDCDQFAMPEQNLGPHVAALGMRFYDGQMFPDEYRNRIFIAEHGSWNRTIPIGYRVTMVTLDEEGEATDYDVFAEGWLNDAGTNWGRPVDVQVMPDGALLVSDDDAGAVYRIHYEP